MRALWVSGRMAEARARALLRLRELVAVDTGSEPDSSAAGVRLGLDRRALAALLVIALGGVVLAGTVVLRSRPHIAEVAAATVVATGSPIPSPGGPPAPGSRPAPSPASELVVDVQGKVRHPGVVRLPAGARVLDALRAAGGPRPGVPTSSLNLAAPLTDGEQVVLDPGEAAAPAAGSGGAGSGAATGGVVDLNRATLADLDGLPGVGPVLAQRILDWREEHGRFSSVEELQEVPGIGPSTYADLKDRVRV
ncbi:MAG TPA: ComEA family DNA-binding protein [Sporichthya sp.]|nr:ComEA family DNA-binding protein [Sporichthya sp.]